MRIHHGVPVPHAKELADVSDFFLIEAGEYLRNPWYQAWAQTLRERGFVTVLDNGAGIQDPVTWSDVLSAYRTLKPTYTVLPDVLFNREDTIAQCRCALQHLPESASTGYTMVIQGNTEDELLQCLDFVQTDPLFVDRVSCIGIPFRMWPDSPDDTRLQFIQTHGLISSIDRPIHLFGCRYMLDYTLDCDYIDSRFAFKHAVVGINISRVQSLPYFKNAMVMSKMYDRTVCELAALNARIINNIRDIAAASREEVVNG